MEQDWDADDHSYPLTAVGVLSFAIIKQVNADLRGMGSNALEHHLKVLENNPGNYRW